MKITLTSLLLLLGFIAIAQPDTRKLDSLFAALNTNNQGMGSVAVSKNGQVIYEHAYGKMNASSPSTTATLYRMGSITKSFTATLILQQVDADKLELSTPLSKFFPKIKSAKKITIKNLLNHSSGIHNLTDEKEYLTYYTQVKTRAELSKIIQSYDPDFEPGEKYAYSNSNYVLLTFILEDVTGKSYSALLKEKITGPLNMRNTYYAPGSAEPANQAGSFMYSGDWTPMPVTDLSVPVGAGAIVSTPADINTFYTGLMQGKLISKESLEAMKSVNIQRYGLGLVQVPFGNRKAYGHTGGIDGFNSMGAYFPDDSTAVTYISNGTRYGVNDVMIGVLSIINNKPYKIPEFKVLLLADDQLSGYNGVYSSTQIPLKITVTGKKGLLYAQATGQGEFPLDVVDETHFTQRSAGIEMVFTNDHKQFVLKQGGGEYVFKRD
ncbi:MAG: serine hydrolase domain-containing protein [Bacteroidota bacterium]